MQLQEKKMEKKSEERESTDLLYTEFIQSSNHSETTQKYLRDEDMEQIRTKHDLHIPSIVWDEIH